MFYLTRKKYRRRSHEIPLRKINIEWETINTVVTIEMSECELRQQINSFSDTSITSQVKECHPNC